MAQRKRTTKKRTASSRTRQSDKQTLSEREMRSASKDYFGTKFAEYLKHSATDTWTRRFVSERGKLFACGGRSLPLTIDGGYCFDLGGKASNEFQYIAQVDLGKSRELMRWITSELFARAVLKNTFAAFVIRRRVDVPTSYQTGGLLISNDESLVIVINDDTRDDGVVHYVTREGIQSQKLDLRVDEDADGPNRLDDLLPDPGGRCWGVPGTLVVKTEGVWRRRKHVDGGWIYRTDHGPELYQAVALEDKDDARNRGGHVDPGNSVGAPGFKLGEIIVPGSGIAMMPIGGTLVASNALAMAVDGGSYPLAFGTPTGTTSAALHSNSACEDSCNNVFETAYQELIDLYRRCLGSGIGSLLCVIFFLVGLILLLDELEDCTSNCSSSYTDP